MPNKISTGFRVLQRRRMLVLTDMGQKAGLLVVTDTGQEAGLGESSSPTIGIEPTQHHNPSLGPSSNVGPNNTDSQNNVDQNLKPPGSIDPCTESNNNLELCDEPQKPTIDVELCNDLTTSLTLCENLSSNLEACQEQHTLVGKPELVPSFHICQASTTAPQDCVHTEAHPLCEQCGRKPFTAIEIGNDIGENSTIENSPLTSESKISESSSVMSESYVPEVSAVISNNSISEKERLVAENKKFENIQLVPSSDFEKEYIAQLKLENSRVCKLCNLEFCSKHNLLRHKKTQKHIKMVQCMNSEIKTEDICPEDQNEVQDSNDHVIQQIGTKNPTGKVVKKGSKKKKISKKLRKVKKAKVKRLRLNVKYSSSIENFKHCKVSSLVCKRRDIDTNSTSLFVGTCPSETVERSTGNGTTCVGDKEHVDTKQTDCNAHKIDDVTVSHHMVETIDYPNPNNMIKDSYIQDVNFNEIKFSKEVKARLNVTNNSAGSLGEANLGLDHNAMNLNAMQETEKTEQMFVSSEVNEAKNLDHAETHELAGIENSNNSVNTPTSSKESYAIEAAPQAAEFFVDSVEGFYKSVCNEIKASTEDQNEAGFMCMPSTSDMTYVANPWNNANHLTDKQMYDPMFDTLDSDFLDSVDNNFGHDMLDNTSVQQLTPTSGFYDQYQAAGSMSNACQGGNVQGTYQQPVSAGQSGACMTWPVDGFYAAKTNSGSANQQQTTEINGPIVQPEISGNMSGFDQNEPEANQTVETGIQPHYSQFNDGCIENTHQSIPFHSDGLGTTDPPSMTGIILGYICCGRTYPSRSALAIHQKSQKHFAMYPAFNCCGLHFESIPELRGHLRNQVQHLVSSKMVAKKVFLREMQYVLRETEHGEKKPVTFTITPERSNAQQNVSKPELSTTQQGVSEETHVEDKDIKASVPSNKRQKFPSDSCVQPVLNESYSSKAHTTCPDSLKQDNSTHTGSSSHMLLSQDAHSTNMSENSLQKNDQSIYTCTICNLTISLNRYKEHKMSELHLGMLDAQMRKQKKKSKQMRETGDKAIESGKHLSVSTKMCDDDGYSKHSSNVGVSKKEPNGYPEVHVGQKEMELHNKLIVAQVERLGLLGNLQCKILFYPDEYVVCCPENAFSNVKKLICETSKEEMKDVYDSMQVSRTAYGGDKDASSDIEIEKVVDKRLQYESINTRASKDTGLLNHTPGVPIHTGHEVQHSTSQESRKRVMFFDYMFKSKRQKLKVDGFRTEDAHCVSLPPVLSSGSEENESNMAPEHGTDDNNNDTKTLTFDTDSCDSIAYPADGSKVIETPSFRNIFCDDDDVGPSSVQAGEENAVSDVVIHEIQNEMFAAVVMDRWGAGRRRGYLCQLCESQFHRWTRLQDHMRQHTGNQPFICTMYRL